MVDEPRQEGATGTSAKARSKVPGRAASSGNPPPARPSDTRTQAITAWTEHEPAPALIRQFRTPKQGPEQPSKPPPGLPVLYQPVPGLNKPLAVIDFPDPTALAQDLNRLRTTPGLHPPLQAAGRGNAARYPLCATATALTDLGKQLT